MILEQLGMLATNEALTTASTAAVGYCLDLASAYNDPGVGAQLWLVIKCTVTGSSGSADGTYQFHLRIGSGTDGTDINAGNVDIITTHAIAEGDAKATAGAYILRVPLPLECNLRYLQVWKTFGGSSPTISVDVSISPSAPPSDRNRQVGPLSPAVALGQ